MQQASVALQDAWSKSVMARLKEEPGWHGEDDGDDKSRLKARKGSTARSSLRQGTGRYLRHSATAVAGTHGSNLL